MSVVLNSSCWIAVKEQLKITLMCGLEVRCKHIRDTDSNAAGAIRNLWDKARLEEIARNG